MASVLCAQSQRPTPTPSEKSSPQQEETQSTTQQTAADQRGTEQSPLIVKTLPTPKTEEEAERERQEYKEKTATNRELATFTKWLAYFTGGLVVVAALQFFTLFWEARLLRKSLATSKQAADAAKQSVEIAAQTVGTMQAQDRAYIFVKVRVWIREEKFKKGLNVGEIVFINHGRTPAILTKLLCATGAYFTLPDVGSWRDMEAVPGTIINPNEDSIVSVRFTLGDGDWLNVTDNGLPLVAIGCIYYEDVFGNKRETGFCWKYDYAWNIFLPMEDKDKKYNYRT